MSTKPTLRQRGLTTTKKRHSHIIQFSDTNKVTPMTNIIVPKDPRKAIAEDLFNDATIFDTFSQDANGDILATVANSKAEQSKFSKYVITKQVPRKSALEQSDSQPTKKRSATVSQPTPPKVIISLKDAKTQLELMIRQSNDDFMSYTDKVKQSIDALRAVTIKLQDIHFQNIKSARLLFKYEIAMNIEKKEFYQSEIDRCRTNIDNCAEFIMYLSSKDEEKHFVQFDAFLMDFFPQQSKTELHRFIKLNSLLMEKIRSLSETQVPDDQPDLISHYMDPTTEVGRIVDRFRVIIDKIRYEDLETIAGAISEKLNSQIDKEITRLFHCAWYFKEYPICDPIPMILIPEDSFHLIPKVFQPPFLDDKWNYLTFNELNSSNWPLKSAVSELFSLMIMRNPFSIAKKFYSIIQQIGNCVQEILKTQNKSTNYIDIDFDQLFVLMLLCIFASGLTEILHPMMYSYSFREFMMDNYQIQFAMSHMEGICTHIQSINWDELKEKTQALKDGYCNSPLAPVEENDQ